MARPRKTVSSKEASETLISAGWTSRLRSWDEIPSWQQDNEYILSGYRQATGSFKRCFESLGYLHNETVNIYSHVIGAAIFLTAPICTYQALYLRYPLATQADVFVFSTFFYGVSICFVLSATYHIISNHSPKVQKFGNQLDYLGIVILMWGSTIPSIYYGFYCDPRLQQIYWANVSILATLCVVATLHPKFRHPTIRPYRAAMYAGLGLSAVVFVVHGILLHGWAVQNQRMSVDWMGLMALFNLTGAAVYAARIPEKLRPLKYDIYGSSHQVLHVAVILAGLAHMLGLFRAFDYLHTRGSNYAKSGDTKGNYMNHLRERIDKMEDIMQLDLQVQNNPKIFGPRDMVRGVISLMTPGNVLISEISVIFTAKSSYSFSPYRFVDTEHALEQTLFRQPSILYSSDKMNPKPPLPAGRHEWPFRFRFPAKDTKLPPSFGYIADTSQSLQLGAYSRKTVRSTCVALYHLKAHLRGTDLPKQCPTATEEHYVTFWPNRYTELLDGPLPKAHHWSISIPRVTSSAPFQTHETSLLKKLRKTVTQTQTFAVADLVAHIPRYSIIGQPVQVNVSISLGEGMHESPALTLESVKYFLNATTRVGRSGSSSRHVLSNGALVRHIQDIATSFPAGGHFIHLHNIAPFIPPISAGWSVRLRKDAETLGPLCPTFESELIARTYSLSLDLIVSCKGKLQSRRFDGGEIVLLPPRLDASVKKGSVTELGEGGIVEVDGDAARESELAAGGVGGVIRVEADGDDVRQELEGENRLGEQLFASDGRVEREYWTRSGELEGDAPTAAELAL